MKFQCFYVSTSRCRFGKVIKNATDMFKHDVLKGAHVHEMTLCVTFGAPHFQNDFRSFTRCSKYAVINMLLGTHVLQTTLCVTFGARLRSVPLPLLGHLVAALAAKNARGLRNGPPRRPFGPPTSFTSALRTLLWNACSSLSVGYVVRRRERHAHEVS